MWALRPGNKAQIVYGQMGSPRSHDAAVKAVCAVGGKLGALEVLGRHDDGHRRIALGDDLRRALGGVDESGQMLA